MKSLRGQSGLVGKTLPSDARWMKTDGWCSLCNEPCSSWTEHISTRHMRHRSLEMMYDQIVHYNHRTWDPRAVLYSSIIKLRMLSLDIWKTYPSKVFFLVDEHESSCRQRLFLALETLKALGALRDSTEKPDTFGSQSLIKGSQIVPCMVMKVLVDAFPNYDSGYLSDILQSICDLYNYEETFRFLDLYRFFPEHFGAQEDPEEDSTCDAQEAEESPAIQKNSMFFTKSNSRKELSAQHRPHYLLKAMIGKLYYAEHSRKSIQQYGACIRPLARFARHSLVSELMSCRLSELSMLADRAWRHDFEYAVHNPMLSRHDSAINQRASHPTATPSSSNLLNLALGGIFLSYCGKASALRHAKHQARQETGEEKGPFKGINSDGVEDILTNPEEKSSAARLMTASINTHKLRFAHMFHRQN
ncbi:hypothetical protein XU18_0039 [Perkinsela sp. CCAP 1560/4]|nr:hypothetical protein XU18_0039 [Perkinsela sp. CCAP 1560/4]|eukprot:KNH09354.1 hypothetical protein XU18_0039 [Perkinsela sp. CCAP 1560/4]